MTQLKSFSVMLLSVVSCIACNRSASVANDSDATPAAACMSQGGEFRRVCVAQEYMCVVPYPDGGKPCKDSFECAGECRIEVTTICSDDGNCEEPGLPKPGDEAIGACQADNDPCGSVIPIKGGRAQPGENRD